MCVSVCVRVSFVHDVHFTASEVRSAFQRCQSELFGLGFRRGHRRGVRGRRLALRWTGRAG